MSVSWRKRALYWNPYAKRAQTDEGVLGKSEIDSQPSLLEAFTEPTNPTADGRPGHTEVAGNLRDAVSGEASVGHDPLLSRQLRQHPRQIEGEVGLALGVGPRDAAAGVEVLLSDGVSERRRRTIRPNDR